MNKNFRLFLLAFTTFGSAVLVTPFATLLTLSVGSVFGVQPLTDLLSDFFGGQSWLMTILSIGTFITMSVMGGFGIVHNLDLAITGKEWE